jgi:glucose/arabinose dehydrogenase/catechol 2,3-dioxygenase-like lactoylglutathione lyase family enzyme
MFSSIGASLVSNVGAAFRRPVVVAGLVAAFVAAAGAQQNRNSPPMPALPTTLFTAEQPIRVVAVATGLSHPWSLAFLPDGSMLVTERAGRLRIIRNGALDPTPISGVPAVRAAVLGGLLDVALHPKFAENGLLYLAYSKAREDGLTTTALARGRLNAMALTDVADIFVANTWSKSSTNYGGRIAFDRDGFLFLTVGERQEQDRAQKPDEHGGKVLRLRDDGTAPPDNPFAGQPGYRPEIYSLGHRSPQGLAIHPDTGAIWENEHGPLGGDEINIILPGKNYGWPLVTYGNDYDGTKISDAATRADLEPPFMYWVPSLAISGLTFYTGDRFPAWKGNAFVGAMMEGRTRGTGHVRRITFDNGRPIQREPILTELHQRIRDVRQGPDGFLYVLTDEDNGAVLRIEPAPQLSSANQAGVAMGHLHFRVKDVDANRRFWTALGGVAGLPGGVGPGDPATVGAAFRRPDSAATAIVKLTDAIIFLTQGESSGVSDGAVVNHVAFRVPSLTAVEAAGLKVERLANFPGVAYARTPDGERVELFEDAATNLTFTQDAGFKDVAAQRHNKPVAAVVAAHHIHLYVPDAAAVTAAKEWYVKMFGGIPGKRSNYDAVDLPGINFNFSAAPKPAQPTRGRMLDHIGFEVTNLAAFCKKLEAAGVKLDTPYRKHADGTAEASFTDPWGTSIELTEGLRGL